MSSKIHNLNIIEILERISDIIKSTKNKDIAQALGVSDKTCSNWKDRNAIPWVDLFNFAKNKKISFIWLLTGKEFDDKNVTLQEYKKLDQGYRKLLEKYFEISEENKKLKELLNAFNGILNDFQPPEGVEERRRCRFEYNKQLKRIDLQSP